MTTHELDAYLADPDVKRQLLSDVQPQGYTPKP